MDRSTKTRWYWQPSYRGFSIGCAIAWAIVWTLLAILASTVTIHRVAYVFLGWVIGFTTATIGRSFYRRFESN
jgi:hypothetical protein